MILAFINKLDLPDFNHGYGNGYVAVSMNELKLSHLVKLVYDNSCTIEVHGGITFYDFGKVCAEYFSNIEWIDDEVDLVKYFVFGFDTCHYNDTLETWPREKVIEETLHLKEQIKEFLYGN